MLATCGACRHLYLRRIVHRPGSDRVRFRELVAGPQSPTSDMLAFEVDPQRQRFVQSQRILFARREKSTQKVGATTITLGQGCRSEETRAPQTQPTSDATAENRWDVDLVLHLRMNVSAEIEQDLCTGESVCASGTPHLVTTGARPCHGSIGQPHLPRLQQQQDGATDEQDNKRRSDVMKLRSLRRPHGGQSVVRRLILHSLR